MGICETLIVAASDSALLVGQIKWMSHMELPDESNRYLIGDISVGTFGDEDFYLLGKVLLDL